MNACCTIGTGMFAAHRRCSDSDKLAEQGYLHLLLTCRVVPCCATLCCAVLRCAVLCCAVLRCAVLAVPCRAVPEPELLMPVGMNTWHSKSWSRQLASQVSLSPGQQALAVAAPCPAVDVLLSAVAAPCPAVATWWAAAGLKRWSPHNLSWA